MINNAYKNEMLLDYIDQSNQNAQIQIGMATSILVAHKANKLKTCGVYRRFITAKQFP